jgi:hypothetical protein
LKRGGFTLLSLIKDSAIKEAVTKGKKAVREAPSKKRVL